MIYGWQRYLGFEKDFLEAEFYVSLDQKQVYSEFFTREIILLGTEIEAALKELCRRLNGSTPGNMGEYKSVILANFPNFTKISVISKSIHEYPFKEWESSRLHWWTTYTNIKHNLVDNQATLGVAMTMLQAYQLLLFCITAVGGDIHLNITDKPKLAEVDLPGNAGAVYADLRIERVYPRQDVLNRLGYDPSKSEN